MDFSVEKKVLLLRKVMVSRCIFSTLYYSLREFSFFFFFFLLSWILVQCFLSLCLKLDLGNITLQDIPITQVRWSGWDPGVIKIQWKLWHIGKVWILVEIRGYEIIPYTQISGNRCPKRILKYSPSKEVHMKKHIYFAKFCPLFRIYEL